MAAPHAEKLEGGVPAPPPPPGPPHPAGSAAAAAGPGRKQGKAGLQMKSPEKKRRKSNTQGPAYSHLSEFAPPPTPMVDHLVASNPFEDDFGSPKTGPPPPPPPAAAAPPPFLGSPVPFGGFRLQPGMAPQVPPGYGGPPQPLRRQPPPPFAPGQLGPAFSMAPQPPPGYGQPAPMAFPGQPFGQGFSPPPPPPGQLLQGPVGGFGPMLSPPMGQPPRGEAGGGRRGAAGGPAVQPAREPLRTVAHAAPRARRAPPAPHRQPLPRRRARFPHRRRGGGETPHRTPRRLRPGAALGVPRCRR